jgi:hypothetical protein
MKREEHLQRMHGTHNPKQAVNYKIYGRRDFG